MNYNLENLTQASIETYLTKNGWKVEKKENGEFISTSPKDILEGQLEIYFPKKKINNQWYNILSTNLNTLAKIYSKSFEEIVKEIYELYYSVFKALVNKNKKMNSLPLNLARVSINNLYYFLLYAYSFEFQPVAHFLDAPKKAKDLVSNLGFPHTFNSSFGLSVQLGIEDDILFSIKEDISIQEKVIDRIFNGFKFLKESIDNKDENHLVDNFSIGFNANMCDALVNIAKKLDSNTITFDASFPHKKKNIEIIKPFTLQYSYHEILTQASLTLKARNPILDVKIEGYVVATQDKSKDLLLQITKSTKRTIVVAGIISMIEQSDDRDSQFKRKEITIYLNEENYNQAVIAHKDSLKVIITGDLFRKNKNDFEIPKVKEFNILNA